MRRRKGAEAVVIGGSAGSILALHEILSHLPSDFQLPLFAVIHLPPHSESLLPPIFQARSTLQVCEAEDKTHIRGGTLYFAPPNYHLLIDSKTELSLCVDEPVNFARPSIDVLFDSASRVYASQLVAIVLSGANEDGALGAALVHDRGGRVVIQTPESAQAPMMPKETLKQVPSAARLSPHEIGAFLSGLSRRRPLHME